MALVPFEAPDTAALETPTKSKQKSLFEFWSTEKETKQSSEGCELQAGYHVKLRKSLSGEAIVAFERSLKRARDNETLVEYVREQKKIARASDLSLVDPALRGRGIARHGPSGRPKGSKKHEDDKTHKRKLGAPVHRRDPTAFEKLAMISFCMKRLESGQNNIKSLKPSDKRAFENEYHFPFEYVMKWADKKQEFEQFVAKHRLGKHGLRPCGVRGKNVFASKCLGARICRKSRETATLLRPLAKVFEQVKKWLNNERTHGHEVRTKTITQQLMYQLEYERDKQLVLQQHASPHFFEPTLRACQRKLAYIQVNRVGKKQKRWISNVAFPNIGASTRAPNRLSDKNISFDNIKAKATWETCDFFVDLVSRGEPAEFAEFVSNPEEFCEHRTETSFVVMDQTALWLKLRGEEQVIASIEETEKAYKLKQLKKNYKNAQTDNTKLAANLDLNMFCEDNPEFRDQCSAMYTTAGDKYRLTLINISGVEGWFDPEQTPRPVKKQCILLVPSSTHARLEYIDKEGKWNRDWGYKCSDGSERVFKEGESAKNLLAGWRKARDEYEHEWETEVLVWGQPRAWTDELISTWVIEHIKAQYGQSIVQVDCLAAQWSEACLLRAWCENILWCPLSPDVTSYLQEPDTHEHSQLKSIIREIKGEIHFTMEQAFLSECKNPHAIYEPKWGPYELLKIVGESLKRFKEKYPRVPLHGLARLNTLVFRPSKDGGVEITDSTAEWNAPKFPPSRGIPPTAALERMRAVRQWIDENKRAPKPDWAVLDECFHFEPHELEHDEAEDTFDFAFQGLELTEHQKLMLLPPDKRIKQLVYPEAVKNRVMLKKSGKRKNQWGAKFGKFFAGRAALRWQEKASKHGRAKLEQEHAPKAKVSTKNVDKKLASIRKGKGKSAESGPTGDKGVIETADKTAAENAAKSKYDDNKRRRNTKEGAREEEGPEHEWLKKNVRVVAECEDEGRAGLVTNVYRYNNGDADEHLKCNILSECGVFCTSIEHLEEDVFGKPKPIDFKLDYRRIKAPKRAAIRHTLEGTDENLEMIKAGTMIEQSTVAAILTEMELRLTPKDTKIVIPSVCTAWTFEEPPADHGGEVEASKKEHQTARHVFFLLWSEPPRHYTMIYVRNEKGEKHRHIEYKDSLKGGSAAARLAGTRLLRNLELIGPTEECPAPSNTRHQADGWSCGLWASRWVERQLRENLGEQRLPPTSLGQMTARANEFMAKIKSAGGVKEKAEDKSEKLHREYKTVEPDHDTFEKALEAAVTCTKCVFTKAGTKGCRACMGEHFESIRQRRSRGA